MVSSAPFFSLVGLLLSSAISCSAEIIVRSTFDRELSPSDTAAVDQAGAVWLDNVEAAGVRRNLRLGERELAYRCAYYCEGWPCGQCYIWRRECWGWCPRRLSQAEEVETPQEKPKLPPSYRELAVYTPECQAKIDQAMLIMEDAVSREGEPIVEASHFSCFVQADEPEEAPCTGVERFELWDSTTNSVVVSNFAKNARICQTNMATRNLEAVVSPGCNVNKVSFVIAGPGGFSYTHTESNALYFLHGNRGMEVAGSDKIFPTGEHTLVVTVYLEGGAGTKQTSLPFTVDGSC